MRTIVVTTDWKQAAADAWANLGWESAREYHEARAGHRAIVEIEPEHAAFLRRLLSGEVSLERAWAELNDLRNRPTPKATIDAVLYAVREHGLAALKETATAERLERCDAQAKEEIERRIEGLKHAKE